MKYTKNPYHKTYYMIRNLVHRTATVYVADFIEEFKRTEVEDYRLTNKAITDRMINRKLKELRNAELGR
jgi:hypothetical protein